MSEVTLDNLTQASLTGSGTFDVLMRATKAHLDQEYNAARIRGTEYSTVYLGSLEAVMRTSLEFILQKEKLNLELQILAQQLLLAEIAVTKANVEVDILESTLVKLGKETLLVEAQTAQINQEKLNKITEELILQANLLKIPKDVLLVEAQTALIVQQTTNEETKGLVLQGEKSKLDAEYDVLVSTNTKTTSEIDLLNQKKATELAQVTATGVDADSVIGRQKGLYLAQTNGFQRNAEQGVAKVMTDTWSVRRTTDEGVPADATNHLQDSDVGRAITKMLTGVGA